MCTFESDLYEAKRLLREDEFFSFIEEKLPQMKHDLEVYRELVTQAIKDKAVYNENHAIGYTLALGMEDMYRFFTADVDWTEYSYLSTLHDIVMSRFNTAIKDRDYKSLSEVVTYMNSMAVLSEQNEFDIVCLSAENLIALLVANIADSVSTAVRKE